MRNGKFFHSYQRRGQKLDIYFESGVKVLNEGDEFLKVYTFDLDQLVVPKVRAVFIANGKRQDIASFEIEWDEVNDIMVPISGRLEKFQNMHIDVNTSQSGKISQEFDFHWFTVNKEIEPQLFSIDNVKDRNAVLSMVDPVKLNATNLIDNDHTQNK